MAIQNNHFKKNTAFNPFYAISWCWTSPV